MKYLLDTNIVRGLFAGDVPAEAAEIERRLLQTLKQVGCPTPRLRTLAEARDDLDRARIA